MANRLTTQACSLDCLSNLANVVHKNGWTLTNTTLRGDANGRDSVEVFATDRDTGYQICKVGAVGLNSTLQSGKFIVEGGLIHGSPETKEEGGLGVNCSLDCRDGCVCGPLLNHGVQSCTSEIIGTLQASSGLELGSETVVVLTL